MAAILVTILVVAQAASGTTEEPGGAAPGPVHVVRPGDTLWEIARGMVGPEGDPRPLVHDIREANGMATSDLEAGSRLLIPSD